MTTERKITIAPGALVCKEAILDGTITVGSGSIIHPTAVIRATKGPIIIGENNNIEETAVIENLSQTGEPLVIGKENIFEIGAVVQARRVGDGNVFGVRCRVGPLTTVTNGCSVGAKCTALVEEELPEKTVICGKSNMRRTASQPVEGQLAQLDFLRKLLPSFHHLLKST